MSGSAGDVVQAGEVRGDIHFHSGRADVPGRGPKPRQLPGEVSGFVDREEELRRLDVILTDDRTTCVIVGTAGVGKTSLAIRWAHRAAREQFPDGQLYVNLRGYDPGSPVTAGEALHQFLTALNVPSRAIPVELEARAALFRSHLAGRRVLMVLDNAATVGQIRPLLPGSPDSLAIVTSRSRLSGLVVRDGARRITLGTLPEREAVALLHAVIGGYRSGDEEDRLGELARLCARLPLALRIAAERAASRPWMRLDDLIEALRDESGLWDALSAEEDEEADAVRSVFAWSYRALDREAAELFRLLGLHPGPSFHYAAAAALAGAPTGRTRQVLDVLVGAHLLEQTGPERYEFHDLMRAYAAGHAQHELSDGERAAALRRVLAWYVHTADAAQARINPREAHIRLDEPGQDVAPLVFADYAQAAQWYEEERRNLLAAVRAAEEAGLDRLTWQLPAVLRTVQMRFNPFDEWLAMGEIGLRAARRVADRAAEAELLESLGMACTHARRLAEAADHHDRCLAIRRELGDATGVALSLNDIGLLRLRQRRLAAANDLFEQALALFRETGAEQWVPVVLSNLAETAHQQGEPARAAAHARAALDRHTEVGDERGQGNALRILASVQRESGDAASALRSAQRAVDIAVSHRNGTWQGYWLAELGAAQRANGLLAEALVSYQRAAVIQRGLGDRSREASVWQGTGEAYQELGRAEDAVDFHRNAARVHGELGDGWNRCVALDGLARAQALLGEIDAARQSWTEALLALRPYPDRRATHLRARIDEELRRAG
jgi:tetratricopeptide (TPR) repeat protein